MMSRANRSSWLIVPLLLVVGLTAACSGEGDQDEREYAMPNPLCGIRLSNSLYQPIFPPGEKAEVENYYAEAGGRLVSPGACEVDVDGELSIYIETASVDPDLTGNPGEQAPGIEPYIRYYRDSEGEEGTYELAHARKITDGLGESWVWPDLAVTSVECRSSSDGNTGINISIRLDWLSEDEDLSDPLADLIVPFAEEQLRKIGDSCNVQELKLR
jgi:hypothetical protein